MNSVKIGIVGLGYMGLHHLQVLRKLQEDRIVPVDIVLVCDVDAKRSEAIARKFNIPKATADPSEFINAPDMDAVILATPWQTHRQYTIEVARLGKAILCEKPLAANLTEVQEMIGEVDKMDIPNQGGLLLRHSPSLWKIKQLINKGGYGQLKMVSMREDSCYPQGGIHRTDILKRIQNRGILWEENIHDIDTLMFLIGKIESVGVSFLYDRQYPDFESGASMVFRTKSGIPGSFCSTWHNVTKRGSNRHLEIFFEKAVIKMDYFTSGDVYVHEPGRKITKLHQHAIRSEYVKTYFSNHPILADRKEYPWYATFADLSFIQSLLAGTSCYPSFQDCLDVHEIVDTIYRKQQKEPTGIQVTPLL